MAAKGRGRIRLRPLAWLSGIAIFLYVLFVAPFALIRHDSFRAWVLGKGVDARILPKDWFLRIDHVDRFDPRGLRMRGIRLEHHTPEGVLTWAELSALSIDLQPAPLLRRRILAPRVRLDSLSIRVDQPPPSFSRTGGGEPTGVRSPSKIPSIQVGRLSIRRLDLRNASGLVARGEVEVHGLSHRNDEIAAEIDTLGAEFPAETLGVSLRGGRLRGTLPEHFALQDVGLVSRGLVSRLDATGRVSAGRDSTLAMANLRIDRLVPSRVTPLRRFRIPFGTADSLRGYARISYASGKTSAVISLAGSLLGAPLDSLDLRAAQHGDTLDLESLAVGHRAGGLLAAGQVILDTLRLRGWLDVTGLDLGDPSFSTWLPKAPRTLIDGHLEGRARLKPGPAEVFGEGSFSRILIRQRPLPPVQFTGRLEQNRVTIDSLDVGDPGAGLRAAGTCMLPDGPLDIRARLSGFPLELYAGPWVPGVPFQGTVGGDAVVSGTLRAPTLRARLDARDFRVVDVLCQRISIDSLTGGLAPIDLVGRIQGQGMNIYGVDVDTAMIDVAWNKTMRVTAEVRRDSLRAVTVVDLVPADPGSLLVEQLDFEPGSLAPWSMTEKARISWDQGSSTIERVRFESTEGLVTGDLVVGRGGGSMRGDVQVEELNLDYVRQLLGLPDSAMVGIAEVDAVIGGKPLSPAIRASLAARNIHAGGWPVGDLRAGLTLEEGGGILVDTLRAGRGGGNGAIRIPRLAVHLPEPLPAFLKGTKDSLAYLFDRTEIEGRIEVDELGLNRILRSALAGAPANGGGILAEPVDPMMTRIRTLRPGDETAGVTLDKAVRGDLKLDIDLGGTAGKPRGKLQGMVRGLHVYQASADSVVFAAAYAPQFAVLDSLVWWKDGNASRAHGRLPLVASLVPGRTKIPKNEPLAFEADLPEIDLAILSALSKQILDPSGILSGSIRVLGTPGRPWPDGSLAIRDGGMRIPNREERLRGIAGDFTLDSTGVRIATLKGGIGKEGKFEVGGWFRDLTHFELDGKITNATAFESGLYHFNFNADLSAYPVVSSLGSYPQIVGSVNVQEGAIIGDMAKAPLPPTSVKRKRSPWHAEIDVRAPGDIRMSTAIASVDLGEGDLHVSYIDPLINVSGGIKVLGGRYRIFNNVFTISSGTVEFRDLGRGLEPILDIYADTQVPLPPNQDEAAQDLTVKIHLTGPVLDLKVEFSSEPVRPEDEIVSLLVMGQLKNPTTGSVGIVDPSRQYLFTELVAQIESQISQLVLPLGNVSVQPGLSPGAAWKINVRQTLLPQVSVAYSRELAQTAGEQYSLRYNLKGKLYLNAGLERRVLDQVQGSLVDRYSLDLKLRFEYK
jgi:hypothetical protein